MDSSEQTVLNLNYKDKDDLFAAYMPYLNNGGVFAPTNKEFSLGDELLLVMKLLDDPETITIPGKVVWITPIGAQSNARAGLGLQFVGKDYKLIRKKIETHLAGLLESDKRTDTL